MANFGQGTASLNVNHCILHFQPQGYREPQNEVGSLSLAERLVEFEPRTFQFLLQSLNPLGHSPKYSMSTKNMENEKSYTRMENCYF